MRVNRVDFSNKEIAVMVEFIANLTRQGLTFTINRDSVGFQITLTGGY